LVLDANVLPNFDIIINDPNLAKFLLVGDMIEAMFEAMPMACL